MKRRVAIALVLGLAAALSAGATALVLWWQAQPAATALERHWAAKVLILAGDGVLGAIDGDADHARFSDPFGVAVGRDGAVYVADGGDANRIRRIAVDGVVSTVAGGERGFRDGPGQAARFDTPSGLAIDEAGILYVADTANNAIRRVAPDGRVTTLAGDGVAGYNDGPGFRARFNAPVGVAVDSAGRVFVADTYNDRIRLIAPDGEVTTLAGGARGLVDGAAFDAQFDTPSGIALDPAGQVFVADTANSVIRVVSPGGHVTTRSPLMDEGPIRPVGIARAPTGDLYVTDQRGRVLELAADGTSRVVAGSSPGFHDGEGSEARFRRPAGVAVAAAGRLVVADADNALVRLVAARSQLELRPPGPPGLRPRFDADRFGVQPLLWPVAPMEGPHEVAGTIGEARGSDGGERFHAGIDVRVPEGTEVRAVRAGVVLDPIATFDFASLNESLRIGPVSYVHIRAGRERRGDGIDPARFVPTYDDTGRLTSIRVKRGARFAVGDFVGSVNAFNHVHVNVGWPGEEYNPLRFRLVQFTDTVPPTIPRGGVKVYDEQAQALTRRVKGRLLVSGRVQVVVDAWDQADGNRPNRRLGVYALGYQLLNRDGSPAGPEFDHDETIRFDRLSIDPEAAHLVYAPGSGIPFYGRRVTRFLYVVTNTFRDGVAEPGVLDTSTLPPGDYTLRVRVADFAGNEAVGNRDVPISVEAAAIAPPP